MAGTVSGFAKRALVAIVLAVVVVAVALLLWRLANVVLYGFAGILVAVLLRSGADLVHRLTRLPVGWSLALVVLVLVGGAGLGLWLLLPPLLGQVGQFATNLPTLINSLEGRLEGVPVLQDFFRQDTPLSDLLGRTSGVLTSLSSTLFTTFNILGNVFLVIITGIFFASEPRLYRTDLYRLLPPDVRPRAVEIMHKLGVTLRNWLTGQLLAMTLVAVFTYLGLLLVGLPYALALGVAAGLLDFVPFLGPILGALPALLIAFTGDGGTAQLVWVLVVYLIVQQLEGNLFQPLIQKQAVAIPPAVLLLALVAFGTLFGFLGLLVATPITAVIIVLVKELYVRRLERDEDAAS
ncbi:AI-2E family transporter [soil metagenome]